MTPKTIITNETKLTAFVTLERAIVYARVSTDEQAESGTSIDNQIEKSMAYAEANGMQVVAIFREDFTGKLLEERPELTKARAMLRAGLADNLIVYKTNRLDRSEWGLNLLILLQELKSLGVSLHYSQDRRRIDLSNPIEALMQSISGWQAGEDHRETVTKLYEGRIKRTQDGYVVPTGSKAPYGYRLVKGDDKKWYFEIDETEAVIIRLIFNWYTIGDETGQRLAIGAIAKRLSGMQIPSQADKKAGYIKKQEFGKWHRSSVSNILKNETYAGIWYFGKESKDIDGKRIKGKRLITVEVPAIIDRAIWELAQEQLKHNKDFSQRNRKHEYLLSRRVRCGNCDYKMVGLLQGHAYYRCPASDKITRLRECDAPYFRCDNVDTKVWDRLEEISRDKNQLLAGLQGYQAQQESKVEPIKRELAYVEELIKEKTAEWEDEYLNQKLLTSERAKAKKANDIALVETVLDELSIRKTKLLAQFEEKSLTDEQITGITAFALQVANDIAELRELEAQGQDNPELKQMVYEAKRRLLEVLDLEVTLFVLDGRKKARITAKYCPDGDIIDIEYKSTGNLVLNRHNWLIINDVIDL